MVRREASRKPRKLLRNTGLGCRRNTGWRVLRIMLIRGAAPSLANVQPLRGNEGMTFRVMGPHEWGRFAPEAWGHLLRLSDSGALNGPELEQVIERALAQFDGRIALEDLRSLMEGVSFDESGPGIEQVNVH